MSTAIALLITGLFGYMVGDWAGLVIALVAGVALTGRRRATRILIIGLACLLLVAAAVLTTVQGSTREVSLFASDRPAAAHAARAGGVVLAAAVIASLREERQESLHPER